MKTYRFRAWDKRRRGWRHSTYFIEPGGTLRDYDNELFVDGHLMLSTGLHAKNGKEIFEGDIVATKGASGEVEQYEVVWYGSGLTLKGESGAVSHFLFDQNVADSMEVIGNIYQSPKAVDTSYKKEE